MCDFLNEETPVLRLFGLLRVHVLLERDSKLLAQRLELVQILLVLALVLNLGLDACLAPLACCIYWGGVDRNQYFPHGFGWEFRTLEDPDSGGEVVDSPRSPEGSGNNGGRGDEIVGEGVVQVALCW